MVLSMLSIPFGYASADTRVPISATGGARDYDHSNPTSVIESIFFLINYIGHSLPHEDRETHTNAMIYAAHALENGEVAEWYNSLNDTGARIRVLSTRPVQGGFCREMVTEVVIKGSARQYSERACKTIDNRFWTFSGR